MQLESIPPPQEGKEKPKSKKIIQIIAILIIAFIYDLSPIDMIPDFIPFLGWGDDVMVTVLSLFLAYKKSRSVSS